MHDGFSRFMASLCVAIIAVLFLIITTSPLWAAPGCLVLPEKALAAAAKTAGQAPLWRGGDEQKTGQFMILVNPKTRHWTAVFVFAGQGKACVLAEGITSEAMFGEPM